MSSNVNFSGLPDIDTDMAAEFLGSLGGEHTFQLIPERGGCKGSPRIIHGAFDEHKNELEKANSDGYGVFVTVNEGDGKGRKAENIKRVRALFVDLDGSPLDPVMKSDVTPHIIIESSPARYHAYWLCEGVPLDRFTELQSAIALRFDGDKAVKDLPRVMRVPGFLHQKREPFQSHIITRNDIDRYAWDELKEAFTDKTSARRTFDDEDNDSSIVNLNDYRKPSDEEESDFGAIQSQCAFIGHCYVDASTLPEPEWYSMLTNVARCKNGKNLVHKLSAPHPAYDHYLTERKIQHALDDTGPHSCDHISELTNGEYCHECPSEGRVKSPVVLGLSHFTRDPLLQAIDEFNKDHAVVLFGGKCLVIREEPDGDITYMTKTDFLNFYSNRTIAIQGDKGKRFIKVAQQFFDSPHRRQYRSVEFSPGREIPGGYNLYKGLAIAPVPGDWSLYRQHILEVIASGDEMTYQYILAWMARIVQKPGGKRPGVALVLRGGQGTGKGVFVNNFGAIFGIHHVQIFNQEQLTGKFNSHLARALFVFCDEGVWAGDKTAEGVLKGLITEPHLMMEPKGKDAVRIDNHVNLVIASNNQWVTPAGVDERRFFVLDVSDKYQQDTGYFSAIQEQMENGGREALLYDLLNMDISDVDLRKFPKTQALLDQVIFSLESAGKYSFELLKDGVFNNEWDERFDPEGDWPSRIPVQVVYDQYLAFCKKQNIRYPLQKSQFGKRLSEYCPGIIRARGTNAEGKRVWLYELPDIVTCRNNFEKTVRIPIRWEED